MPRRALSVAGLAGLTSTAIRAALGTRSCSNCSRFVSNSLAKKIDPRQISARPGEAGDKTELDRVFADTKDDRDRRGRSFGHLSSVITRGRGDNGHATTHEVSHERLKAIELAF